MCGGHNPVQQALLSLLLEHQWLWQNLCSTSYVEPQRDVQYKRSALVHGALLYCYPVLTGDWTQHSAYVRGIACKQGSAYVLRGLAHKHTKEDMEALRGRASCTPETACQILVTAHKPEGPQVRWSGNVSKPFQH